MAADNCRRDHTVRSGPNKFGLSLFFRSPRDDMKAGVQIASCQNHVDVVSIVWQTGSKPTGVFYPGFAQGFFKRSVAHQNCYSQIRQLRYLLRISFDNYECVFTSQQTAHQMRSDPACTADDKMISEFAHFP